MAKISVVAAFVAVLALLPQSGRSLAPLGPSSETKYDRAHLRFVPRFSGSVPLQDGRTVQAVIGDWMLQSRDYIDLPITEDSILLVRSGGLLLELSGKQRALLSNDVVLIPSGVRVRVRPKREASVFTIVASRAL
ncbi:MAG: hypothetical protein JO060_01585 [Candidatus Eremiobacteraeota bacterium]|nr:hypothetical protein [Candidatus Eremiobacteraeota bacterium]